jgi:hypothetical protein
LLHQLGILVDEVLPARFHDVHDVRHRLGEREQLADTALAFRARRERLHEVGRIDAGPARNASSESENETSTSLMSFSGSTPCFFSIRANGPWVPPPMIEMPTGLALQVLDLLDRRVSFTAQ